MLEIKWNVQISCEMPGIFKWDAWILLKCIDFRPKKLLKQLIVLKSVSMMGISEDSSLGGWMISWRKTCVWHHHVHVDRVTHLVKRGYHENVIFKFSHLWPVAGIKVGKNEFALCALPTEPPGGEVLPKHKTWATWRSTTIWSKRPVTAYR